MRKSYGAVLTVYLAAVILLSACAGPSTRVLPKAVGEQAKEGADEIPVVDEADLFYLKESLDILAAMPRENGSRGENDAARYMQQLLTDYGYEVEHQKFRRETGEGLLTGSNLIATRKTSKPDADILLICTHHDSATESPGALDNASGAATLLETARLLSVLPSDTEVRFVSFFGHNAGNLGAEQYVESLTKRERERMIGAISLDTLGYVYGRELILTTMDGKATMLGDTLADAAEESLGERWQYRQRTGGEDSVLFRAQIPVVTITRKRQPPEAGTPLDTVDIVDARRLAEVVDVVCQTAASVMDPDSPSMTAKAHFYNNLWDYIYVQKKEDTIPFGEGIETVRSRLGVSGTLKTMKSDAQGRPTQSYSFSMKWFGMDQTIPSDYCFVDGKLDAVSLYADAAGVGFEEMKECLTDIYGEPLERRSGQGGTRYSWTDPVYRKIFSLIPGKDGYDVEIREYSPDRVIYDTYRADGTLAKRRTGDKRAGAVMSLVKKIFPENEYDRIGAIVFYTDGIGGEKVRLSPIGAPGGADALWEIWIDLEDALDEDGNFRDEWETIRLLTELYGQLLEAAEPDGCRAVFGERFLNTAPGTIKARLEPPDFKEAFAMFVLAGRPEHKPGDWNERVNFFYEFEQLTSYRDHVRQELGIKEEYAGED